MKIGKDKNTDERVNFKSKLSYKYNMINAWELLLKLNLKLLIIDFI